MAAISSFELFIYYTAHTEAEMTDLGKGKIMISDTIFTWKFSKQDCSCDIKFSPENER